MVTLSILNCLRSYDKGLCKTHAKVSSLTAIIPFKNINDQVSLCTQVHSLNHTRSNFSDQRCTHLMLSQPFLLPFFLWPPLSQHKRTSPCPSPTLPYRYGSSLPFVKHDVEADNTYDSVKQYSGTGTGSANVCKVDSNGLVVGGQAGCYNVPSNCTDSIAAGQSLDSTASFKFKGIYVS